MSTLTPTTHSDPAAPHEDTPAAQTTVTVSQRHRWLCRKLAGQATVLRRVACDPVFRAAALAARHAEQTDALLAQLADAPASLEAEGRLAMHADSQRRVIADWHAFCGHAASANDRQAERAEQLAVRRAEFVSRPAGYLRQHLASQAAALAALGRRTGDSNLELEGRLLAAHTRAGRVTVSQATRLSAQLSHRMMLAHLAAGHYRSVPQRLRPQDGQEHVD